MKFAQRLNNVETSAIRELFKLLGKKLTHLSVSTRIMFLLSRRYGLL